MRPKTNVQPEFNFQPSNLKVTNEYYAKYEAISQTLDHNPKIVDLMHKDLVETLEALEHNASEPSAFKYTSETILRILLCQIIEGLSLREVIIRIDDSNYLRHFVRIYNGPMIDFTTFCKLKSLIGPETWEEINKALAKYAVDQGKITGEKVRLDTTAVETNIHYPTDSSLLWDVFRVLAGLLVQVRALDPQVAHKHRLHTKRAKRLHTGISRKAAKKQKSSARLKPLYKRLIRLVEALCQWSLSVSQQLEERVSAGQYSDSTATSLRALVVEIRHYNELGQRIIDQARRRVLLGEQVPNGQKVFSIFEPHTELLKRGKAGKDIEFGHMVQIQQVGEKFITDYAVYEHKPVEHQLVEPALQSHQELFGEYPQQLTADKGYYENMESIEVLSKKVGLVSIAKKGRRIEAEKDRETDPAFRHAQRFRAGVEGTISFLKRVLGMFRCYNKGWEHYVSTIGATIFAHNLLILARC